MSKHTDKLDQVDEATPDSSYAGLKKAVDEGYKKFLKKRNLESREPFHYGKFDKDKPKR
tara:strand:+ start:8733 stop:8909 length:177 start_codon:yes stop_codon:yes gene_type:complete